MNIDRFLDRQRKQDYNCGHFVAEVFYELTGKNIDYICQAFNGSKNECIADLRSLERIKDPETPCIAVMKMTDVPTHVGVFIDGKILHLKNEGVKLDDLGLIKLHYRVSYYK